MVHRAFDAGINHFDTANVYGNGAAERILGSALVGRPRDDVIVATKVFHPTSAGDPVHGLSPAAIHHSIDQSLSRLGLDYVDIYYFHKADPAVPIADSLGAMGELVDAGKIRYAATSNFAAWRIAEARATADAGGFPRVHITQPMYNLLARGIEQEYADASCAYRLANIVYNPLAGGLLTGKHRRESAAGGTRFDLGSFMGTFYRGRYWQPLLFDAVAQLSQIAGDAGLTLAELSYRWLLGRALVSCVLVGASRIGQLESNLGAAAGPPLAAHVVAACDVVWTSLRGPWPRYDT
jgi:aryl-alcohol dehydrogenase-like predicted oxidoreductase